MSTGIRPPNATGSGLKILSLGHRYAERLGFPDVVTPVLQRLAQRSEELVQLAVVEGGGMRFIAKAEGDQRLRVLAMLGQRVPINASSICKAWLATLSETRVIALIGKHGMPRLTSHTITHAKGLLHELRRIAKRGYATVVEEIRDGAAGVGMTIPVGNPPMVMGGISIVWPLLRIPPNRLTQLPGLLRPAIEELAAIWPREMVSAARSNSSPNTRSSWTSITERKP
jgi:IclR family acetate operon transcriptional repressor